MSKKAQVILILLLVVGLFWWRTRKKVLEGPPPYTVYLPVIMSAPPLDLRFGIAEDGEAEMDILGFSEDGRFHAQQWRFQEEPNSVRFLRSAHRRADLQQLWCIGEYRFAGRWDHCTHTTATSTGWVDEPALCSWVQTHPGRAYIIGNELLCVNPCGDDVTVQEYARWYADAWRLIKACDPTAKVGPFGPTGPVSKLIVLDSWLEYRRLTGHLMPADFYSVHHYAVPGFLLQNEIVKLTVWVNWLEEYRGRYWVGPKEYWLTEYGLPSWDMVIPEAEGLRFMRGFTDWLKTNNVKITAWAWWPCDELALVVDGQRTALGNLYYELAAE